MKQWISELTKNLSHFKGKDYLSALLTVLNRYLAAKYIAIADVDSQLNQARVLVGYLDGKAIDGFEYSLMGTPCETVLQEPEFCFIEDGVQQLFPKDVLLQEMAAASYLGYPIVSEQGLKIGILTILFADEHSTQWLAQHEAMLEFSLMLVSNELTRLQVVEQLQQEQQRLLEAQDVAQMGHYRWDLVTQQTVWSPALCHIFAVPVGQTYHHDTFIAMVHPQDLEKLENTIARCLASPGEVCSVQYRIHDRNGQLKHLNSKGWVTVDQYGQPIRMDGVTRDISEFQRRDEQLTLAKLVFDNTSEAILITDRFNRILAVNPAFTDMTGYQAAEVLGQDPAMLSSGRQSAQFYHEMWQNLQHNGSWSGEIWNRRKDGSIYPEYLRINCIYDEQQQPEKFVAIFTDITRQKAAEEKIRFQANYDALTLLPNRSLFIDRLNQALEQCHRYAEHCALLFIDLDQFKGVNDSLGHLQGDELLKQVAARLTSMVRQGDTVARLGGDEFAVIVRGMHGHDDAATVAVKIQQLFNEPFVLSGLRLHISASLGIALFPDDSFNTEGLMSCADQALFLAKQQGRNTFRFFTKTMQKSANRRLRLKSALFKAIEDKRIDVHYQPIVDCQTGQIVKCEALARWHDDEFGMVSPAEFIAVAEEFGLMPELGNLVLHKALSDWAVL